MVTVNITAYKPNFRRFLTSIAISPVDPYECIPTVIEASIREKYRHGYPFGEVRVETDYAPLTISDGELILPAKAVMTTVRGKRRDLSVIQFSGYRNTRRIPRLALTMAIERP